MIEASHSFHLRMAHRLSVLIYPLATVVCLLGLFSKSLYRETAWAIPQMRGQDLVTLLALPVMGMAQRRFARDSASAPFVWLGLLGYLFYTYLGAAFAYNLNECFLGYVALFSLSGFAIFSLIKGMRIESLERLYQERLPRRAVSIYLGFIALQLCMLWLGQLLPFFVSGRLPEGVVRAGNGMIYPYVLDLGLVVPLSILGARLLWARKAWGLVLAGYVLIKATAMGFALISMTLFVALAGEQVDVALGGVWIALAATSLGFSMWFFRGLSPIGRAPCSHGKGGFEP